MREVIIRLEVQVKNLMTLNADFESRMRRVESQLYRWAGGLVVVTIALSAAISFAVKSF